VFFYAELVTRLQVNQKQAIAIFLHEIGHVANRGSKSVGDEHDADDFAVKCGFGEHLMSGLEHLQKSNTPYFHTPEMKERISRLRKTCQGGPQDY
jgi:Zn-dependent protease with chaperone function